MTQKKKKTTNKKPRKRTQTKKLIKQTIIQQAIPNYSADQLCKTLQDENAQLRLELQNLKDEKFNASFLSRKKFCGR